MLLLIELSVLIITFLLVTPIAEAVQGEILPHHFSDDANIKAVLVFSDGTESVEGIFQKAKCVNCHKIPGIRHADGRIGPRLIMGTIAPKRLSDPSYHGSAKTVREYVMESILDHHLYIPKGMRSVPMPMSYRAILSAGALDQITTYLASLEQGKLPMTPPYDCQSDTTKETKQSSQKIRKHRSLC